MIMANGGADRLPGMGRGGRGGFQSGMFGMTPELRALIIKAQQGQWGFPPERAGMYQPGEGGSPGERSIKLMTGGPLTSGMAYNDGQDMISKAIASAEQNMANMSRKQRNKAKADAGIAREKKGKGGGSKPPASAPPPAKPKKAKKSSTVPPMEY